MENFEFIKKAHMNGVINEITVNKNEIFATDPSSIIAINTTSKRNVFNEDFGIHNLRNFLKISSNFETFDESNRRIVMKNAIQKVEWLKSDTDSITGNSVNKEKLSEIDQYNISNNDTYILHITDDIMRSITQAIESGFAETISIHTKNEQLLMNIGSENDHIYEVLLASNLKDKNIFLKLNRSYFEYIIKTISVPLETKIYIKSNYPIKVEENTPLTKTVFFMSPIVDE